MSKAPHSIHHLTLLVRDLDAAIDRFQKAFGFEAPIHEDVALRGLRGARMTAAGERRGMEGWRIQDLEPDDFFGVPFQFTEDSRGN